MATLAGTTIASTYALLLKMASGGVASGLVKVQDGDATDSALSIGTVSIAIDATDKLYLDGGTHTYIDESAADIMDFYSGGTHMLSLDKTNTEVVINEGSADINFRVESNGDANMLFVDGGNNRVGIGTASPAQILEISQDASSLVEFIRMSHGTADEHYHTIDGITHGSDATANKMGLNVNNGTNDTVVRVMTLRGDGNVGIGTVAPTAKLNIVSAITGSSSAEQYGMYHSTTYDTANTGLKQGLRLQTTANHTSVGTGIVASLYSLLSIATSIGSGGTTTTAVGAYLRVDSASGSTITNAIACYLAASVAGGTMTNRWGLYSADTAADNYFAGSVGIGINTPTKLLSVVGDPGNNDTLVTFQNSHSSVDQDDNILQLQFSGDAGCTEGNFIIFSDSDTAEMGVIKANSATVTVDEYSDYRIKNSITDIAGGLDNINKLRPVNYRLNAQKDSDTQVHEGFIAHEVQEHIPYVVAGVKDAMKTKVTPAVEAVEAVEAVLAKDAILDSDGNIIEEAVEAVEAVIAVVAVAEKTEQVISKQSFCVYQLIPQMVKAIQELSAKVTALENA